MKIYKFEGASDDTFGEYAVTSDDYDNCANGAPIRYRLATPNGAGIIVTGCYAHGVLGNGCWMIGVEAIDEDKQIDWQITHNPSHEGYRGQLLVVAPDDAELVCLNRDS